MIRNTFEIQVTPIWEGTTNILSLDVLRALAKSKGQVLLSYRQRVQDVLNSQTDPCLSKERALLEKCLSQLIDFAQKYPEQLEYVARDFSFGLARTLAGALLLEHATWSGAVDSDRATAKRWLNQRDLLPQVLTEGHITGLSTETVQLLDDVLVFDGYDAKHMLSPLF